MLEIFQSIYTVLWERVQCLQHVKCTQIGEAHFIEILVNVFQKGMK